MAKYEIEDSPCAKYPKRISVAISEENYAAYMELKNARKNVSKLVRTAVNEALSAVSEKKAG